MADPLVVYGRQPVLEALADPQVVVEQVLVSRRARVHDVVQAAEARGVPVRVVSPDKVSRMSGNARHDQGVVADVRAPGARSLADWLAGDAAAGPVSLVVLDGVTNPSNVGMVVRTVVAAGWDGVVLPRAGSPEVGPLVVKASAGVALRATVLAVGSADEGVELLREAGVRMLGLAAGGGRSVFEVDVPERVALVLGNESQGLSVEADELVSIPMAAGVESLNVAVAAGVACYALGRSRGDAAQVPTNVIGPAST